MVSDQMLVATFSSAATTVGRKFTLRAPSCKLRPAVTRVQLSVSCTLITCTLRDMGIGKQKLQWFVERIADIFSPDVYLMKDSVHKLTWINNDVLPKYALIMHK